MFWKQKFSGFQKHLRRLGSKSWDTACIRIVTWLKLKHRSSGKELLYINTHLDHKSKMARQKGAELISERVKQESEGKTVIITGDFNAVAENSKPWKIFINNGFNDSWLKSAESGASNKQWCGFRDPEPDATNRIDWILYQG